MSTKSFMQDPCYSTYKVFIAKHNVTGFVKRGLPHTSNLPTLTIHNVGLVKTIGLKFAQCRAIMKLIGWIKFKACRFLEH